MNKILLIATVSFYLFSSCKKDEVPLSLFEITNGSFDSAGSFSTDGWTTNNSTSDADVPSGGGTFSLKISPASFPGEGYADYTLDGITGTHLLKLTAWIKSFDSWPGSVTVKKKSAAGILTVIASVASDSSEWTLLTVEPTITFNDGDLLIIHLSAGSSEIPLATQYSLFDLITLIEE